MLLFSTACKNKTDQTAAVMHAESFLGMLSLMADVVKPQFGANAMRLLQPKRGT